MFLNKMISRKWRILWIDFPFSAYKLLRPNQLSYWMFCAFLFVQTAELWAQKNPYDYVTGHPRIVMSKYDELALRFSILEDPLAARLKTELKKDADKLLTVKDLKYVRDKNNSITELSKEYLNRILTLSLAYRIFEEEKYSDKAIEQMMDACAFPDWNSDYFMDAAIMTAAMSIGYDWNFYHLDLRQNETIRNRILEFCLNPGLEVYRNPDGNDDPWFKRNNYTSLICASGLILGALAVGDDFPDVKNQVLYHAVRNLLPTLELYEPDGVWYEGPASWVFGNNYLALAMSAMTCSLGHDFGLSSRPGMDKTAKWYTQQTGPSGHSFGFGIMTTSRVTLASGLAWYAGIYEDIESLELFREQIEKQLSGDVIYQRDATYYAVLPWLKNFKDTSRSDEKLTVFEGVIDMLIFNAESENMYMACKGGRGDLGNQQLDAGSFVVDALGVRWGLDPATTNISFKNSEEAWESPINTNTNHNTLVINGAIQKTDGDCRLVRFDKDADQPFGIIDLIPAYPNASKALRGFRLLNEKCMLVCDEIKFDETPCEVRWAIVTDANISLDGNRAELTKAGKHFYLLASSTSNIEFEKEVAATAGHTLLILRLNKERDQRNVNISVIMGTDLEGIQNPSIFSGLDAWK